MTEQTVAVMRARNRAFRWPKGVSGNPDGQSRHYHACRKLARDASPAMMLELIGIDLDAIRTAPVTACSRPKRGDREERG